MVAVSTFACAFKEFRFYSNVVEHTVSSCPDLQYVGRTGFYVCACIAVHVSIHKYLALPQVCLKHIFRRAGDKSSESVPTSEPLKH